MFTRENRERVKVKFEKPSLCQRQFAADADINQLVRRFMRGDMSVISNRVANYIDASGAPESFHDAMNRLSVAETVWQELPEQVRASFGSPANLLAAVDAHDVEVAKSRQPEKSEEPAAGKAEKTSVTPEGQPSA